MDIDFNKNNDGLVPAIIQDANTKNVLMLGYMNSAAYEKTLATNWVTFFSRSKQRLWTKGEESGNRLKFQSMALDCDQDTLLIQALPEGPICHKGTSTCWGTNNTLSYGFLSELEAVIENRSSNLDDENSYIASLFRKGINTIAQKVGEEAVELIIEAKDTNDNLFLNESADLLFHYLILLQAKGYGLKDIAGVLKDRQKVI